MATSDATPDAVRGPLALVGGEAFAEGCTFDRRLLEASGAGEVLVLPTAAAYEHPERVVEAARRWFAGLGATVRPLMVLSRPDASDPGMVEQVRAARFVYLAGTSAMHLRSVMKDTPLWGALVEAWSTGAVLAGSSAAAMAMCDPMVDPRGGAFTLGLGLVEQLAVITEFDTWSHERVRRTFELAGDRLTVVGIARRTALVCDPDGTWWTEGVGEVVVHRGGTTGGLELLAAVPQPGAASSR